MTRRKRANGAQGTATKDGGREHGLAGAADDVVPSGAADAGIAKSASVSCGREATPRDPEWLRKATGIDDLDLQERIFDQLSRAARISSTLPGGVLESHDNASLIAMMEAIAPNDGVEGMMAAQMVGIHESAMECLGRAMLDEQSFEGRDMNLKHAEKLIQLYARQLEVLDKRRGRGQQKITVEHVTVEAGGQAIMGDVHLDEKKSGARTPAMLADLSVAPLDPAQLAPARRKEKQPVKRGEG